MFLFCIFLRTQKNLRKSWGYDLCAMELSCLHECIASLIYICRVHSGPNSATPTRPRGFFVFAFLACHSAKTTPPPRLVPPMEALLVGDGARASV